jgi:hypothetical protein
VLLLIPSPVNFISQTVLGAQREERLKERGKDDAVRGRGVWSEIRRQQAGGLQKGVVYLCLQIAPSCMSPMQGEGGELRGLSQ